MNYNFKTVFNTNDIELANRLTIILQFYKLHPHFLEKEDGNIEIKVPEKDFEICSSIVEAVESSKFEVVQMELHQVLGSNVSVEKIEEYLKENQSKGQSTSDKFLSPKRLLLIYLMTSGLFVILTLFITLIRS